MIEIQMKFDENSTQGFCFRTRVNCRHRVPEETFQLNSQIFQLGIYLFWAHHPYHPGTPKVPFLISPPHSSFFAIQLLPFSPLTMNRGEYSKTVFFLREKQTTNPALQLKHSAGA